MKKNIFQFLLLGAAAVMTFSACSDSFLEDKKNYDNVTPEIYNFYSGANSRVSDVYGWSLPNPNNNLAWKCPSAGWNDDQAKCTEEYSGFGSFVDPENELKVMGGGTQVPDYYMGDASNIQASVYGRIRNINDVIEGISGSTLSQSDKDKLLGQVYFFRAWCYYLLVKWYGGVPIVTEVQNPTSDVYNPRRSAQECIDFILNDLQTSATMLQPFTGNGGWASSSDYGRITTAAALALKDRVLLLWASPLFNRANDESRWQKAYDEMKADLPVIKAGGHDLYQDAGNVNGSAFAKQFLQVGRNPEAIFQKLCSNVATDAEEPYNMWEEKIRPVNTFGKGNFIPSSMIVDIFPMKDGKRPQGSQTYTKLAESDLAYDSEFPFENRDPRFYRTFAFPGERWAYNGDPTKASGDNPSYGNGKNYELWSYVWYTQTSDAGNPESGNAYGADNLLKNGNKSLYVRKRSDDADLSSPLYVYDPVQKESGFRWSAAPFMEIRFAEVLLNLAEAACMTGNVSEAVDQLKLIRQRAGYTAADNFGLDASIQSDKAACMSAILYERQIEFAYEGKRFDDMRRWLLFDGGAGFQNIPGAPSSWTLTGWGGNTCSWLGVKPMNGQRRENIEFRTADKYGVGGTTYGKDATGKLDTNNPLVKNGVEKCKAVDLRQPLEDQLTVLKAWYKDNLAFKKKKGDATNSDKTELYIDFLPRYYFLGLNSNAMSKAKKVEQTIGWENPNEGGANGTFDPLAAPKAE